MLNDLVSIIVPIYQAEKYLRQCVDSLVTQTYRNIEIILVNDGSTDGSSEICDEYAAKDERVIAIHKKNGGVSSTRNVGLAVAKGEYVIFVDSDDWVEKNMVELLYCTIVEKQVDLTIGGITIDRGGKGRREWLVDEKTIMGSAEVASFLSLSYCDSFAVSSPVARCYKKSLCSMFKEDMSLGEDMLFNVEYFEKAESIALLKESVYSYRKVGGSSSLASRFAPDYFDHFRELYRKSLAVLYQKGKIDQADASLVHNRFVYYSLYFMKRHISLFKKEETLSYIRNLCNNFDLRQAVQYTNKKYGVKVAIGSFLIKLKAYRLLYWLLSAYKSERKQ